MRLLRVLGFGLVHARLVRQVLGAVALADQVANLRDRVVGERDRVGTHIGDQADRSLVGVDALV